MTGVGPSRIGAGAGGARRVLHVLGRMNRGGAEIRTLEAMRRVDPQRFALDFCALSGLPGDLDADVAALGGRVIPCRLGPTFPWRFGRLVRAGRYDVVHSHVETFSGAILRLAARARVPVRIAHFRNTSDGRGAGVRPRVQRRLMLALVRRHSTCVLAVSRAAMRANMGGDWERDPRARVVYNGVDLERFAGAADRAGVRREFGVPDDAAVVVHVGNISPAKNQARVLRIFAALGARMPAARLILVGRGDATGEAALQEHARSLGVASRVVMAGSRGDVPRLLASADAMLFPSLWEGLPGAVLEACAAGLPVVASDIEPVREIAAFFPAVRRLPLDASDATWADAVAEAARARTAAGSADGRASFAGTPFTIEACVRALCWAWAGHAGAPEPGWLEGMAREARG